MIRNNLFHSHNFKVTDDELTTKIEAMVTLLQDRTTLLDKPCAQEAVNELRGVKRATNNIYSRQITVLYDYVNAFVNE